MCNSLTTGVREAVRTRTLRIAKIKVLEPLCSAPLMPSPGGLGLCTVLQNSSASCPLWVQTKKTAVCFYKLEITDRLTRFTMDLPCWWNLPFHLTSYLMMGLVWVQFPPWEKIKTISMKLKMWKQSRTKSQWMLDAIITVGLIIFSLLWSLFSNIPRNFLNGIGFILALLEYERKYRWSQKCSHVWAKINLYVGPHARYTMCLHWTFKKYICLGTVYIQLPH